MVGEGVNPDRMRQLPQGIRQLAGDLQSLIVVDTVLGRLEQYNQVVGFRVLPVQLLQTLKVWIVFVKHNVDVAVEHHVQQLAGECQQQ